MTSKKELQIKMVAAQVAGTKAFKDGKQRTPWLDSVVIEIMEGLQVGEGIPVMKAWYKGWDLANINS